MAKYTSKLNLKKPEANDFYNVEDSNGNFDKIDEFASRTDNPHSVTKAQVGLGNVDNTSDKDKPISTAQATAINEAKSIATSAKTSADIHATSRNNPHNVTASQIGALPLSGGTLTDTLRIDKNATPTIEFSASKSMAQITKNASDTVEDGLLIKDSDTNDVTTDYVTLRLNHKLARTDISQLIKVSYVANGNHSFYKIYGEHNMPNPTQIQTGSYVGTGLTGKTNAVILNFSFVPEVLYITGIDYNTELPDLDPSYKTFPYGALVYATYELADKEYDVPIMSSTNCTCKVSNGGKTLSFYCATNTSASHMANTAGMKYHYVAIGYRKEW